MLVVPLVLSDFYADVSITFGTFDLVVDEEAGEMRKVAFLYLMRLWNGV